MASSRIVQLSQVISESVKILHQCCADEGVPFPDLNDTFNPEFETFRANLVATEAADRIAAAASQLVAAVLPPSTVAFQVICNVCTTIHKIGAPFPDKSSAHSIRCSSCMPGV